MQPIVGGVHLPSVRIEPSARPETATVVRVAEWEGPLGLLLSLIEARRLDVLTVPLGGLAEAYLEALAGLEGDRMASISAFVSVASQLILIKSRALLPRTVADAAVSLDEEEDPEAALRARLLLYRAFRDAGRDLQALADVGRALFRREPSAALAAGLAGAAATAAAAPPMDPLVLVRALDGLVQVLPEPEPPPEVMPRTVTLAERAAIIRLALREAGTVVLQELLRGVRDRIVVAVTFLALLELMKRREVVVEQAQPFGPITARRATEAQPGHDEFDESLESFA